MAVTLRQLRQHEVCGRVTQEALVYLEQLFAAGPEAMGSTMAGRAEQLVGSPATVSASVAALAGDLIAHL